MKLLPFMALMAVASVATAGEPQVLAEAAQRDLAAAEMGRVAEAQGLSERTRAFGRMLVADFDRHRSAIMALAEARRVKVRPALTPAQKADVAFMAQMKGAAFDEAFKTRVIADRQSRIAEYRALLATDDAEVAALAQQALPVLERHLAAAEKL